MANVEGGVYQGGEGVPMHKNDEVALVVYEKMCWFLKWKSTRTVEDKVAYHEAKRVARRAVSLLQYAKRNKFA